MNSSTAPQAAPSLGTGHAVALITGASRSRKDGDYELFFDTLGEILGRPVAEAAGWVSVVVDFAIDVTGTQVTVRRLAAAAARDVLDRRLMADLRWANQLPHWLRYGTGA